MLLLKAQLCEDKIEHQNTKVYNTQTQKRMDFVTFLGGQLVRTSHIIYI